ncbi:hypothetical protein VTO73DRAFT_13019 [Trametes versicolor]
MLPSARQQTDVRHPRPDGTGCPTTNTAPTSPKFSRPIPTTPDTRIPSPTNGPVLACIHRALPLAGLQSGTSQHRAQPPSP